MLRDWLKVHEVDVLEFWLKVALVGDWDEGSIVSVFSVFSSFSVVIGEVGNIVVVEMS